MKSSLEQEYSGILGSASEQAAAEREHLERVAGYGDSGTKWMFGISAVEELPYIRVACSKCRNTMNFFGTQQEPSHRCFGVTSYCPPEIIEQWKTAQMKKGLRKAEGFFAQLFKKEEKKPEPKPAMSAF